MEALKEKDNNNSVVECTASNSKYINLMNNLHQHNVEISKTQRISYEMDVEQQKRRNLERDIHLLKTENERLSFQLRRFGGK